MVPILKERLAGCERYIEIFGNLVSSRNGLLDKLNNAMRQAEQKGTTSRLEIELARIDVLKEEYGDIEKIHILANLAKILFAS
jgi:hypothetical protein